MKTLTVYATEHEGLASIFPRDTEWEMVSEDCNDDRACEIVFEWNGEMQRLIEQRLNKNRYVVSYSITD